LAGPYFGFRLAAEGTESIGGRTETRDVDDQFHRVDTGVSFGVRAASFDRFLIEGRWSEGLRDIDSQDLSDTTVRHRVFAVLAGVSVLRSTLTVLDRSRHRQVQAAHASLTV
jgi:hypothetical protein